MELRPYQRDAIDRARDLINGGKRKVCLVAPCGAGKGLILATLMESARQRGKRVLAIVHRRELVEDLAERVERMGFRPGVYLPGHDPRPERAVQVGSVQTLARRDLPPADLLLVDECFPAGTMISGRGNTPIEEIRVGDYVDAWNDELGRFEGRRVLRVFVRPEPDDLIEIRAGGCSVVCTLNHPFLTSRGWLPAGQIGEGDAVLLGSVFPVRSDVRASEQTGAVEASDVEGDEAGLLLANVSRSLRCAPVFGEDGANESEARVAADEEPQPDATRGRPATRVRTPSSHGASAACARGKGETASPSAGNASRSSPGDLSGMGTGGPDSHSAPEEQGATVALYDRPRAPCDVDGGRGRRGEPLGDRGQATGRGEGLAPRWARVDRVALLERSRAVGPRGMRRGRVFNLEVEGLHTYVANGFVVHNCHHSTASTWKDLIDAYPRAAVVGTTATPCRLGGAPLGDVFQALVEVVKPGDLVQDGFLVPVTGYAFDAPDLRGVRRASGDYEPEEIARLMGGPKLRGSIVESYLQRARGTRAICFAVNVAHSRQIAADFVRAGVQAEHVDGETPRALRRIIFERFRSGSTRVLCNVGLFTEGVDLPSIETVILARPTLSLSLALQMIGRGRRPIPCACGLIPHWRDSACRCGRPIPKKATRVHDHAGVVLQHGLPDEPRVWSLDGDYRVGTGDKGAKGDESKAIRVCRSCLGIYLADEPICPLCGKANPAPKKLVRNGNGVAIPLASLESVNRPIDASEQVRRRFFWFLLGLEKTRGYKRGYAEVRFHGRFHMWAPSKAWRARFEAGEPADPPPAQVAPEGATHA